MPAPASFFCPTARTAGFWVWYNKNMRWPLEKVFITQPFGSKHFLKKINPVPLVDMELDYSGWTGEIYRQYGQIGHNGIDFRASVGTPVYAIVGGLVIKTRTSEDGYGNYLVIRDDFGGEWTYAHLSERKVEYGAIVKADGKSMIGLSGNSAGKNKTAPHLHVGYRPKGYDKNNGYLGHVDFMDKLQKIAMIQNNKDLWHYFSGVYTQEARVFQEKLHKENEFLRS